MSAFKLRWGIISTGGIATSFTKDLLVPSSTRDADDVEHILTAVGSRSTESAQKFIDNVCTDKAQAGKVKACGTYQEVYDSADVDVVYIGTPHTYHYENTKDALNAGKHVLCEKPFTFDATELQELVDLAKEKKRFLMEAVWTRFHPIVKPLQEEIFSGKHGRFKRMFADLSFNMKPDELPDNHRMVDPKLGGGALLDLGPYPMVWTMLIMHQNPLNKGSKPPSSVVGQMDIYERSGVDESSLWLLRWDGVGQSTCASSMSLMGSSQWAVIVQMENADIHVHPPAYAPTRYTVVPKRSPSSDEQPPLGETKHFPLAEGRGMAYQADGVARSIRDGKLENETCSLTESLIVQKVFDEVRKQGGYTDKGGR